MSSPEPERFYTQFMNADSQYSRPRKILIILEVAMILVFLVIWLTSESLQRSKSLVVLFFYSFPSEFLIGLVPHEPVLLYFGRFYHPFTVALVSVIGTVCAEALNYSVFSFGNDLSFFERMRRKKVVNTIVELFKKAPFTAILIAGFTPVPFFPIRFLVVMGRYPKVKYLAGVFLSRAPRFYILAQIGHTFKIPGVALLALFIVLFISLNFHFIVNIVKRKQ